MDILDDMGVSKLSAEFFVKVNYSFKEEKKRSKHSTCQKLIQKMVTSCFDMKSCDTHTQGQALKVDFHG